MKTKTVLLIVILLLLVLSLIGINWNQFMVNDKALIVSSRTIANEVVDANDFGDIADPLFMVGEPQQSTDFIEMWNDAGHSGHCIPRGYSRIRSEGF